MQLFPNPAEQTSVPQQTATDSPTGADEAATSRSRRRRTLPLPPASVALRGRERTNAPAPAQTSQVSSAEDDALAQLLDDEQQPSAPSKPQTTSMWRGATELETPSTEKSVPTPTRQSVRRVKTKLLDFGDATAAPRSVVDETAPAATAPSVTFPVGWLILVEGPGRGECFTLKSGVSQIGRDAQETVSIDFGDLSISRKNHASIAYDPEDHCFYVGHGGKANIVRLNGKPVLSTEELSDGDTIKIGETSLRLKTLCDESFNWSGDIQDAASLLTE